MKRAISLLLLGAAVLCLQPGCGTVVAKPVTAEVASFDGNEQNSGILEARPEGYLVTAHFRDRYNALIADYGEAFSPELKKDAGLSPAAGGRWIVDREHMIKMIQMNTWRKSGRRPL